MAAYEGHLEIVECLLRHGADGDAKDMVNKIHTVQISLLSN